MIAVDTSVVVPALLAWHETHEEARQVAGGSSVPAHALVESYSVLTRLPGPHRVDPVVAAELLGGWFPAERVLLPPAAVVQSLAPRLAAVRVSGSATYDGLVGVTAAAHGLTLATRDARAASTYERLGVMYRLLDAGGAA